MLPFVIMNLIVGSGYGYASQMGYHYTFGTVCLLFYMTIINSSEFKEETRRAVIAAAAVAAIITASALLSTNFDYCEMYRKDKDQYQKVEECLKQIPEDACVASAYKFLPHIADRKEVYLLDGEDYIVADGKVLSIKDMNRYEFFVFNAKDGNTKGAISILESNGYKFFAESGDSVVIYRKPG